MQIDPVQIISNNLLYITTYIHNSVNINADSTEELIWLMGNGVRIWSRSPRTERWEKGTDDRGFLDIFLL